MRYIKVLLMVLLIFLALVFFFQNQKPLSQEMVLTLNLFFVPPMSSISLPLYFVVASAFVVGAVLATCFFWWNKVTMSTRLMTSKWRVRSLEKELLKAQKAIATQDKREALIRAKAAREEKKDAPAIEAVAAPAEAPRQAAQPAAAAAPAAATPMATEELVPDPDNR